MQVRNGASALTKSIAGAAKKSAHHAPRGAGAKPLDDLGELWDGLPSHRSHLVRDFVREQRGRLWLEFLPAYAPELNPVEYLWSHWKQHELPNFCPSTFAQLSVHARRALKRMRQRPTLVMAFWQQARLFPL